MSEEAVLELARNCEKMIEFALPQITDHEHGRFQIDRLCVALEALSRFVVRLEPQLAEATFSKALKWYGIGTVAKHFLLADPIQNILKRSWEAMPDNHKTNHILDILSAPIAGLDGFPKSDERYPDPGRLLLEVLTPSIRTSDNDNRWREVVSFLARALCSGGEVRKRASVRMSLIHSRGLLKNEEQSILSDALWGENYKNDENLPSGTSLNDWAFLISPEPEKGIAEQRFRKKWLDTDAPASEKPLPIDDTLNQIGSAMRSFKNFQSSLKLSDGERKHIASLVAEWVKAPVPHPIRYTDASRPVFPGNSDDSVRKALEGLRSIILEIQISKSVANKLLKKFQNLNNTTMPGFALAVGLVNLLPERFNDIVLSMRTGIASDSDHLAKNAVWGLHFWLLSLTNSDFEINQPPDDLVREIGIIIATRRKTALGQALQVAKWIFTDGDSTHREVIGDLAAQGLGYLSQELRYDEDHSSKDKNVPLLRWGCAHLAVAMEGCGFDDPAVSRWVEIAKSDPLPEVRHAKRATTALDESDETGSNIISGEPSTDNSET